MKDDLISRQAAINAIIAKLDAIDHVPQWVFDELTGAIGDLPSAQLERKKGWWILDNSRLRGNRYICDQCGYETDTSWNPPMHFCPNCFAEMRISVETARNIVHEAIDNSVWSDAVDTAKMHKIVDDKYAEIRGDANEDAES